MYNDWHGTVSTVVVLSFVVNVCMTFFVVCALHTPYIHIQQFVWCVTENVLYLLDLRCRGLEYNPLNSAAPALFEGAVQLF